MPESARIIRFPSRPSAQALSPEAAEAAASEYLNASTASDELQTLLSHVDVLFAVRRSLYERRDSAPVIALEKAAFLHRWISDQSQPIGLFDERDYLMGEFALIAGAASRQLGKREQAERWLDKADASFRHAVNPGPKLAEVSYLRLALKYDMRQFGDVLELVPSLSTSFAKLGMQKEVAKADFLKAMSLKASGRSEESFRCFETLALDLNVASDSLLLGQVLIELGASHAYAGRYDEALEKYRVALSLLKQGDRPIFLAHLKATVGETLVLQGRIQQGISAYREAISDYAALGLATQVAYLRVVNAEALLSAGRHREAEWEILAALPTIEEQKMVPEGFAAVALLRESVRRRKTDPNALRELREHLQANT